LLFLLGMQRQYKLFERSQSIHDLEEIGPQISLSQGYELSNEERERERKRESHERLGKRDFIQMGSCISHAPHNHREHNGKDNNGV